MQYIKDNEVLYLIEHQNAVTCDYYNIRKMYHNPEANFDVIKVELLAVGSVQEELKAPYVLVLDFLGNIKNPTLDETIKRLQKFLEEREISCQVTEIPLKVTIVGIDLNDVCMLIDSDEFQNICNTVKSASVWHLFGTI